MDLLQMLKQANLFSPTGQMAQQQFPAGLPSSYDQTQMNPQDQGMDLNTAIQGLLNPKDEQFQNFDQMIQAMPQRSNYPEPGFWKKFQAHIAGMGAGNSVNALNVTDQIEHAPYYKALDAWKNQIEPTEKIAQMEQTRNVGNRQTGIGILQREAADKRIEETERKNREAEADRDAERERKIAHDKVIADTRTWIQSHPQYEGRTDKDGKLFYVNKTDPSDIKDSGIDTGKLGDLEKSDLNIKGKLQEIQARGQVATDLEGKKQANRVENEATRQLNRIGLKETPAPARPTSTTPTKPLLPTQVKQDVINKALKLVSEQPDLKPYIKFEKNNAGNVTGVTIPPIGDKYFASLRGYKESDRMKAYNALFGQPPISNQKTQSVRKEIPGHPGKFAVSTDGGKTWKAE